MKLPVCLYQKAFWIVIPILIGLVSGIYATVQNDIYAAEDRINILEKQVNMNNVPELKGAVSGLDEKLDIVLLSQARIEVKVNQLLNP